MKRLIFIFLFAFFNFSFGQIHPNDIKFFRSISKDKGIHFLDSLILNSTNKSQLIYSKAMILSSVYEDNQGAIDSYLEYLKINKDSASNSMAYFNIANNNYQLGRMLDAKNSNILGLKLNPENPYLLHQRGLVIEENTLDSLRIQENYYRKSLENMYKYDFQKRDSTLEPMILGNLGFNLYHQKRFDESEIYLKKSVNLDHKQVHILNNLANTYQRLDKLNESIEFYEKALAIDPNYLYSINGKANTYFKMGDLDLACQNWKKSIDLGYIFKEEWADQYDIEDPKILISKHCKN